jgi:hypothetical protein
MSASGENDTPLAYQIGYLAACLIVPIRNQQSLPMLCCVFVSIAVIAIFTFREGGKGRHIFNISSLIGLGLSLFFIFNNDLLAHIW